MHKEIKQKLNNLVDEARIPHAILFSETSGNGALVVALDFIQYILCKNKNGSEACNCCNSCHMVKSLAHPDLHFVFPTNSTVSQSKKGSVDEFYPVWRDLLSKNMFFGEAELYQALGIDNKVGTISVADASDIMRKLSLSSYEGGAKIVLIMFPERMNVEAANKLLKSLEEPLPDTYFILISHSPQKLLTTILSRCLRIEIPPVSKDEISLLLQDSYSIPKERADFIARCSCGSIGKAISISNEDEDESNSDFLHLLDNAANNGLYKTLLIGEKYAGMGRERTKSMLTEGLDDIRNLLMLKLNLNQLSYANRELDKLNNLKNRLNEVDIRNLYNYTDMAARLIERNVNAKFVFADLCNHIYFCFNKSLPYGK